MLTNDPTDLPINPDVVIVGSGAVGLTLAARLSALGRTVVILESGRRAIDLKFRDHNQGVVSGRPFRGLESGRYRGLGGTTRLWGGQLMRLSDARLDPEPALNKPGWPLSADELARYEDQVMGLLGLGSAFADAMNAWTRAAKVSPKLDDELQLALSLWMPQPDFSQLFNDRLMDPGGPAVLLGHEVTGLACDEASGRISGVLARWEDGTRQIFGRQVVLAGGTLENLRLLLRAKAALPQTPLAENHNVGRWFIDHLHGNVGTVRPRDPAKLGQFFDTRYGLAGLKVSTKVRLSGQAPPDQAMAACAISVTGQFSPGDIVREFRGLFHRLTARQRSDGDGLAGLGDRLRLLLPLVWNYVRHQRSGTFLTGHANFGVEVEQLPCAESRVTLAHGTPIDQAMLDVHWQLDGREVEAVADLCRRFGRWCETTGYATIDYDPRIDQLDPAVLDRFYDSSHQMGGARMARSAEAGVVDADLRVFGMPGLSVAGAAVFPSGGFANPTLSAMALGLRLADRLARETAQ